MNNDKIIITRVFNAPKAKVFTAWTEPEQIKKWWGPSVFSCPVAKVDLRVGGKYLYCMHGLVEPFKGKNFWSGGVFKEIDAPNKLVLTDYFSNEKGEKVSPAEHGLSPDFPAESHVTILFEDAHGKTKLSITYDKPKSAAALKAIEASGMNEGWNSSLDKLQAVVEHR